MREEGKLLKMADPNLNRNGTGATGRGINMHSPMATAKIPFTQINLQHCKAASAQFTRLFSAWHTGIALIQEPWILQNEIKGLNGADTVFRAAGTKSRTCIVTRGLKAELIPRYTNKDLTTIRIKVYI